MHRNQQKEVWDEIQEMASEAWEKNKHDSDEKK